MAILQVMPRQVVIISIGNYTFLDLTVLVKIRRTWFINHPWAQTLVTLAEHSFNIEPGLVGLVHERNNWSLSSALQSYLFSTGPSN